MSRTDSHVPDWVESARALPWQKTTIHYIRCREQHRPYGRRELWVDCDLADGPFGRCKSYVEREHNTQPWARRGTTATSSRARLRDELRLAALEYNTFGQTDVHPAPYDDIRCLCQMCGCDL